MIAANRIGISDLELGVHAAVLERLAELDDAISATAPPPTPLNSATICGIAVIFTERARGRRRRCRSRGRATIRPQSPMRWSSSVATTAIAMPTAATWLPRTAVRGPRACAAR